MDRKELVALRGALDVVLAWPDGVREQMARWLAPAAAKPNRQDVSREMDAEGLARPPPAASTPRPKAKTARRANPSEAHARAAERRLLATMQANPGLPIAALVKAAGAGRSSTGERLRRLAQRGAIEKDAAGRWRLKAEAEARPTAAAEAERSDGGPAAAGARWVRPLGDFERRESSEVHGRRFG